VESRSRDARQPGKPGRPSLSRSIPSLRRSAVSIHPCSRPFGSPASAKDTSGSAIDGSFRAEAVSFRAAGGSFDAEAGSGGAAGDSFRAEAGSFRAAGGPFRAEAGFFGAAEGAFRAEAASLGAAARSFGASARSASRAGTLRADARAANRRSLERHPVPIGRSLHRPRSG
jgi:hypothetical protein